MQVIYNFVSMALWYTLRSSIVMPLPRVCVLRIALSIWPLFMEFKIIFSSMKNKCDKDGVSIFCLLSLV